jgi:hypothetical protein
VGNTEPSAERVFPSFDKPFVLNFDYQEDCEMKVSVYDAPDKVQRHAHALHPDPDPDPDPEQDHCYA